MTIVSEENEMVAKIDGRLKLVFPVLLALTGSLLAAIPGKFFPVCGFSDMMTPVAGKMMRCNTTGSITFYLGIATLFSAIFLFYARSAPVKRALLSVSALSGCLLFLLYTVWPGVCMVSTMPCRIGTLPAALLVGGIQLFIAGLALIKELRR